MTSQISDSIFGLSKMGLQNLQHEPQRLMNEATRLNGELEILVMENYKIFVENLSCSVQLRAEDHLLEEVRNSLKGNLKGLAETCKLFRDNVTSIINAHKRNRKTLQHHMQLVELLEVPQLVDACARNGFYDEALELANFVNGLERRHLLASEVQSTIKTSKGSSENLRAGRNVVQSIVDDVYKTLLALRSQLLQLLTEDSSLPQELQILGTLRKLDGLMIDRQLSLERYNNDQFMKLSDVQREDIRRHLLKDAETRLQMSFLEARSIWLNKLFERSSSGINLSSAVSNIQDPSNRSSSPVPNNNFGGDNLGPYGKAIEMLEVNRTAWFSIITQFNALFAADHKEGTSVGSHPTSAILHAWVTRQVSKLLYSLKILLPQIEEGGSIRSILEQTMFFSSRMREVGGDFSGLAMPIFTSTLVDRVVSEWRHAIDQFKKIIETEKILIESDDYSREQVVPLYAIQDEIHDETGLSTIHSKKSYEEIPAPISLLAYPPLAYLINAILTGLNIIRECPLATVKSELVVELEEMTRDLASFIIKSSKQLASKGMKYLSTMTSSNNSSNTTNTINSHTKSASKQGSSSTTLTTLDKRYASALALDFLPHILLCFETLFPHTKPGSAIGSHVKGYSTQEIATMFGTGTKVKRGTEHRELIGKDLFLIQQVLLDMLLDADLLPKELKYSHSLHIPTTTTITTPMSSPKAETTKMIITEETIPEDLLSRTNESVVLEKDD